ncbi:hypothetical protein Catovirus_1_160 [Catovirus CTV1]|uniref:Uncharacterized protein n=1 Tax=Catovirus CTV1 TaxID=1977631 RepID=A0A1V0S8S4_9VIRU|nr:hypothetical protein Catovirus_1_160 [Catovirus CTV1]
MLDNQQNSNNDDKSNNTVIDIPNNNLQIARQSMLDNIKEILEKNRSKTNNSDINFDEFIQNNNVTQPTENQLVDNNNTKQTNQSDASQLVNKINDLVNSYVNQAVNNSSQPVDNDTDDNTHRSEQIRREARLCGFSFFAGGIICSFIAILVILGYK